MILFCFVAVSFGQCDAGRVNRMTSLLLSYQQNRLNQVWLLEPIASKVWQRIFEFAGLLCFAQSSRDSTKNLVRFVVVFVPCDLVSSKWVIAWSTILQGDLEHQRRWLECRCAPRSPTRRFENPAD